jgi:hypothetical protein
LHPTRPTKTDTIRAAVRTQAKRIASKLLFNVGPHFNTGL